MTTAVDLEQRTLNALLEVADDIKAAKARDGDLATLTTTAKTTLVAAVNELKAANDSVSGASLQITNNLSDVGDAATARTNLAVNSSTETTAAIATAIAGVTLAGLNGVTQADIDTAITNLVGAAPAELDTLKEIADELAADNTAFSALVTDVNKRVRFDSAQSLSDAEKLQAQQNLGIAGTASLDFKQRYITQRDA